MRRAVSTAFHHEPLPGSLAPRRGQIGPASAQIGPARRRGPGNRTCGKVGGNGTPVADFRRMRKTNHPSIGLFLLGLCSAGCALSDPTSQDDPASSEDDSSGAAARVDESHVRDLTSKPLTAVAASVPSSMTWGLGCSGTDISGGAPPTFGDDGYGCLNRCLSLGATCCSFNVTEGGACKASYGSTFSRTDVEIYGVNLPPILPFLTGGFSSTCCDGLHR